MMRKHSNPYRINDPNNPFEVCENSSHPELQDKKRYYRFKDHTFRTATELEKFMKYHGYNPRNFWFIPKWEKDTWGTVIRIEVAERVSAEDKHRVREYDEVQNF